MKHKKLVLLVLLAVLTLSLAVLGACSLFSVPNRGHEHVFAQTWSYDTNTHWHSALCEHSNEISGQKKHKFVDGVCSECNYVEGAIIHEHTYSNWWISDESGHWHKATCWHSEETTPKQEHTYDIYGDCTACGYHTHIFSNIWRNDETNHWHYALCEHRNELRDKAAHAFVQGVCSECGYVQGEQCLLTDGAWSDEGNYFYFGEYPQSEVAENAIIAALNWEAGALPTEDNAQSWIDYGYKPKYRTGGMWYIDIVLNGIKYRGVYFTKYRMWNPNTQRYFENSFLSQVLNGYYVNNVYWFKFEPIRWRVLSQTADTAFLMCDSIIDSQSYQEEYWEDDFFYTNANNAPQGTYASNYQYSTIRSWLNNDFYNAAFSLANQQRILVTEVDNSAESVDCFVGDSDKFVCDNTNDKIFLLSCRDWLSKDNGFNEENSGGAMRLLKTSAYAQAQGAETFTQALMDISCPKDSSRKAYLGCGTWWLRSPNTYRSDNKYTNGLEIFAVIEMGYIFPVSYAFQTTGGVVPALQIKL